MMMNKYCEYTTNFLINSTKYVDRIYLNNDKAFTRKGKLSLEDTIKYPLLQEGHTNSREANDYIRLITGDDYAMITQQAIGEKRGYIDPNVYKDMYKDFVDGIYNKFGSDLRYKGKLVLAGDTTVIKLPNVSKCKEEFPVTDNHPARARLSTFADALSGFIYSSEIVEKDHGEVDLALKHLNDLNNRNINDNVAVTYDRGYCSCKLLFSHLYYGIDILLRLNDSFLSKEISQMKSDDEIIKIFLNKKKTNTIPDDKIREHFEKEVSIDVRITKVEITKPNGETYTETLLSTLPMEIFSAQDLKTYITVDGK